MAFVVCSSVSELNKLTEQLLEQELNIQRIDTRIVMDAPKWMAGYPLDSLSWKEVRENE